MLKKYKDCLWGFSVAVLLLSVYIGVIWIAAVILS
jgi:hypothetical protein